MGVGRSARSSGDGAREQTRERARSITETLPLVGQVSVWPRGDFPRVLGVLPECSESECVLRRLACRVNTSALVSDAES